jgi:lipoate-protein ligase A
VVLGASQRKLLASLNSDSVEVVARKAGGGAVLAGPWMLSTSVALPADHPLVRGSLSRAYEWIGTAYSAMLVEMGVDAQPAVQKREAGVLAWACFAGVTPWEVLVDDRKIVGLAQSRNRLGVLLVAGILLDVPDWSLLCRVMGHPDSECGSLADSTAAVRQILGRPVDPERMAADLSRRFAIALGEGGARS